MNQKETICPRGPQGTTDQRELEAELALRRSRGTWVCRSIANNAATLTVTSVAEGTESVSAHLVIIQLQ